MIEKQGEVSEWNEGNFKSLRLHQVQELINICSLYPFKKTNGEWNYKILFSCVNVLFKEGMQKYSGKEYDDSLAEKERVEILVNNFKISSKEGKIFYDVKEWMTLKKSLEKFEYNIKFLNDKHGLSTRNERARGLF